MVEAGDKVRVTNRNGETAPAIVVDQLNETAENYMAEWLAEMGTTSLYEFWEGNCDPEANVVQICIPRRLYHYPVDHVKEVEG